MHLESFLNTLGVTPPGAKTPRLHSKSHNASLTASDNAKFNSTATFSEIRDLRRPPKRLAEKCAAALGAPPAAVNKPALCTLC